MLAGESVSVDSYSQSSASLVIWYILTGGISWILDIYFLCEILLGKGDPQLLDRISFLIVVNVILRSATSLVSPKSIRFFMKKVDPFDATHVYVRKVERRVKAGNHVSEVVDILIDFASNRSFSELIRPVWNKSQSLRYFDYMDTRYILDSKTGAFTRTSYLSYEEILELDDEYFSRGLTDTEASFRLSNDGPNRIQLNHKPLLQCIHEEFSSVFYTFQFGCIWFYILTGAYASTCVWLLVSLVVGLWRAYAVRFTASISLYNELNRLYKNVGEVEVIREGRPIYVASVNLVVGDVVVLEEQKMVPAEIYICRGTCICDEQTFTGEYIAKMKKPSGQKDMSQLRAGSHILSVANREKASVLGYVFGTRGQTTQGKLAQCIVYPVKHFCPINRDITLLYVGLTLFGLGAYAVCKYHRLEQQFMLVTCLLEIFSPMLPIGINSIRLNSAKQLDSHDVKTALPDALIPAGIVDTIVFDKTGCLTNSFVQLDHLRSLGQDADREMENPLIRMAVACCITHRPSSIDGNPLELSMLKYMNASIRRLDKNEGPFFACIEYDDCAYGVEEYLEFSHVDMVSGTMVRGMKGTHGQYAVIKGSPDAIASRLISVPEAYYTVLTELSKKSFYVLALGYVDNTELSRTSILNTALPQKQFEFLTFLVFSNEIRQDSLYVVERIRDAGLRMMICSGDSVMASAEVGRSLGFFHPSRGEEQESLLYNPRQILQGCVKNQQVQWQCLETGELEENTLNSSLVVDGEVFQLLLNNPDQAHLIEKIRVFGRMKPAYKEDLIKHLTASGRVVAMVGDGSNDLMAMTAAPVGIVLNHAKTTLTSSIPFICSCIGEVPDIIRVGRFCVDTTVSFAWVFACYAIFMIFFKSYLLIAIDGSPSEFALLSIDVIIGILTPLVISRNTARRNLFKENPDHSLFQISLLIKLSLCFVTIFTFGAYSFFILRSEPFYFPYLATLFGIQESDWIHKSENFESAAGYVFVLSTLLMMVLVLTSGNAHKLSSVRNYRLMIMLVSVFVFLLYLALGGPSVIHCLFHVNCDHMHAQAAAPLFISQISGDNLGGCYWGPQLTWFDIPSEKKPQISDLLDEGRSRDLANEFMKRCRNNSIGPLPQVPPHVLRYQESLKLGCSSAPNNCFSSGYIWKLIFLLLCLLPILKFIWKFPMDRFPLGQLFLPCSLSF